MKRISVCLLTGVLGFIQDEKPCWNIQITDESKFCFGVVSLRLTEPWLGKLAVFVDGISRKGLAGCKRKVEVRSLAEQVHWRQHNRRDRRTSAQYNTEKLRNE